MLVEGGVAAWGVQWAPVQQEEVLIMVQIMIIQQDLLVPTQDLVVEVEDSVAVVATVATVDQVLLS
jgi:hypothetical protein